MAKSSKSNQDKRYLLYCCLIFAASLGGLLISNSNPIEEYVFRFIYDMPGAMSPVWLFLTQFGSFFAVLAVIIVSWLLRYRHLAVYVTINTLIAYGLSVVLKEIIARPRPLLIFDGVVVRDAAAFGFGFPSGHTAIATALAFTLWPWLPRKYHWLLVVWVGLVAVSRLYLGVHAPLDVIGGFAIGAGSVFACRIVMRDILKRDK